MAIGFKNENYERRDTKREQKKKHLKWIQSSIDKELVATKNVDEEFHKT